MQIVLDCSVVNEAKLVALGVFQSVSLHRLGPKTLSNSVVRSANWSSAVSSTYRLCNKLARPCITVMFKALPLRTSFSLSRRSSPAAALLFGRLFSQTGNEYSKIHRGPCSLFLPVRVLYYAIGTTKAKP